MGDNNSPGIIPRALGDLYKRLSKEEASKVYYQNNKKLVITNLFGDI